MTQTPTISSTSSAAASSTAVADAQPKAFLQNKALSGIVFTFVGMVALVILVSAATFALRRSRKKQLLNEALSFDPVDMDSKDMIIETGRRPTTNRSSISTGHTIHGNEPIVSHANTFNPGYAPPVYSSAMQPYMFAPTQQANSSGASFAHQPYSQRFDRSGPPVPEGQGYEVNPVQPGTPQQGPSTRRSQSSSSGDFQFAAVTPPPGALGACR